MHYGTLLSPAHEAGSQMWGRWWLVKMPRPYVLGAAVAVGWKDQPARLNKLPTRQGLGLGRCAIAQDRVATQTVAPGLDALENRQVCRG